MKSSRPYNAYNTEKYTIFCLPIPTHGTYSHCMFLPHGSYFMDQKYQLEAWGLF